MTPTGPDRIGNQDLDQIAGGSTPLGSIRILGTNERSA